MKKKELLKEVSSLVKGETEGNINLIDNLGHEFYERMFKINFSHIIIYSVFLILSLLLFNRIDHLSFISEEFYVILVSAFLVITLIISIVFFTLYIYNIDKNNFISLNSLKNTYRFYQIYDILSFISLFLTIFLWLLLFIVTPVAVSGSSMENTFYEEDKILVWHIGYEPTRNDVVIIDGEGYYSNIPFVIKRIVATSGDSIAYGDGALIVNGKLVSYVTYEEFKVMVTDLSTGKSFEADGVIPEGYSIVLGDNRTNSQDSKSIGLVKDEDILGVVFFRIYPFESIGIPEKNYK